MIHKMKYYLRWIIIGLRDFFPFHLLMAQFKYNFVILFYWLFLFATINGYFGASFGIQNLFTSPEYLGGTSILSFFLLGFSIGGFFMAFHTYSYIRIAQRYAFIATLERPFFKFCINNSIVPTIFAINLAAVIWSTQREQELLTAWNVINLIISFLIGIIFFIFLSFLYFFPTNKDIFKISGKKKGYFEEKTSNIQTVLHKQSKWYNQFLAGNEDRYFYIGKGARVKRSRSTEHYDIAILNKVFAQNQTNASFFEIALIISFLIIGFFKASPLFQVPAAVSLMLLLTIVLMVISSFYSWFKNWTYPILILSFITLNYLSKNTEAFRFQSYAFGLSYENDDKIEFSPTIIHDLCNDEVMMENDYQAYLKTLSAWKEKTALKKPKLFIVNTSGGGLRSALWTFSVLQKLDSLSENQFSSQVQMITGASGGMIGAAYYRDLLIDYHNGELDDLSLSKFRENIGKDLLNSVAFAISTSDIFFRFQRVNHFGHSYLKDRGFAFEQNLIQNLDGKLNTQLKDYLAAEQSSTIPTMIFTPTIINDGRRLIISSQGMSFLNKNEFNHAAAGIERVFENVDYQAFFHKTNANDIAFSSVLRMNATFPYILPIVTLPTDPPMLIMDAGIRDNYGTKTTVNYLKSLRNWLAENTSGVVLIKIRDTKKKLRGEEYRRLSLLNKMIIPFGNLYGNFPRVQDFDQDELLIAKIGGSKLPFEQVTFNLRESTDEVISLSWHLNKKEKRAIFQSLNSEANLLAFKRVLKIMEEQQ